MIGRKHSILILLLVLVILTGCGKAPVTVVNGIVDHPHRIDLPLGSVVTVQIVEMTKDGSPGKPVAEQVITDQEIVIPTPFVVIYDRAKINQNHMYIMQVKIADSTGQLLYASEAEVPVITKGNPTQDIDVPVVLPGG